MSKIDLSNDDTSSCTLNIKNVRGLHARASAKFVKCAETFQAQITVSCKGHTVPGTSIMGLMMLGASPGTQIIVEASGLDHRDAISTLSLLVNQRFGED